MKTRKRWTRPLSHSAPPPHQSLSLFPVSTWYMVHWTTCTTPMYMHVYIACTCTCISEHKWRLHHPLCDSKNTPQSKVNYISQVVECTILELDILYLAQLLCMPGIPAQLIVQLYVHVHICTYVHVWYCLCVCVCVCLCVCACVCVCVRCIGCMYMYMYIACSC